MDQARVDIAGVVVDVETEASAVARVMGELSGGRGGLLVTVNLDHVRRCRKDARYAALVRGAGLVVADGMPLVWASRVQGTRLPERVAGSNLIWSLSEACAREGRSVFLLGGDPGAGEGARAGLEAKFPGLRVAGVMSPARGFEQDAGQLGAIERAVAASGAGVVFVALGSPKQEYLGERLLGVAPGSWFVGCGISLSFVAGQVRRAPRWMQRCGLEWAHRLVQEPGRLARRYLVDGIPFAVWLLAVSGWRRVRRVECRVRGRGGEIDGVGKPLPLGGVPLPLSDSAGARGTAREFSGGGVVGAGEGLPDRAGPEILTRG